MSKNAVAALQRLEYEFGTKLESADEGERLARFLARDAGLDEEEQEEFSLAVRECLINAVEHGNRWDVCKRVKMTFVLHSDGVTAQIFDQGCGFDLAAVPNPISDEGMKNTSGRGLYMAKFLTDEMEVGRVPNGGAVVTLTKRHSGAKK